MLTEYYMFLPGITSAPEVKFVHGSSTMAQKLVLLVDIKLPWKQLALMTYLNARTLFL